MSAVHGLGVAVGSATASAAIDEGRGAGYRTVSKDAILRLHAGESPRLGAESTQSERHTRDVVIDGFLARVGDPVGLLTEDGATYAGEDLTATAIECLVHEVSAGMDLPTIVVGHPATWSPFIVDTLMDALDRSGLSDVTPVTEAEAALRWLESTRGPLGDGALVVYDLGASFLDITVLRTGANAGIIGKPFRSDEVCGTQFDHLTMRYVLSHLADQAIDPFDPATERALRDLRAACARGKEELSSETETDLTVELPGMRRHVRLVRGELEDLLRAPLAVSMGSVREAVHTAGLELRDIDSIVLIGGGASIPLVAEMVSSDLGLSAVSSDRPYVVAAIGAAMVADDIRSAVPTDVPIVDEPRSFASPPVAAPVRAELPPPDVAKKAGHASSRAKKVGFVSAAAVAITILAAGGLALGTGGSKDPQPPAAGPTSSTAAPTTPGGELPVATDGTQPVDQANTGTAPASPTSSGSAAPVADSGRLPAEAGGQQGTPAQGRPAPAAAVPAAESPAPQQAPEPAQNQAPAPEPASPPAQSGGGTPQLPQFDVPTIEAPSVPSVPWPNSTPGTPRLSEVLPRNSGG